MKKIFILVIFLVFYQAFANPCNRRKAFDYNEYLMAKLEYAFIKVESNFKRDAYNFTTGATGILQECEVIIDEANRIIGYNKWHYNDRWSIYKSLEVFRFIMLKKNPSLDPILASNIWYCGHTWKHNKAYYEKIKAAYDSI